MPERIQLRRTKGWRKPVGAITVARPSRYGNPWRIVGAGTQPGLFGGSEPIYTIDGPGGHFIYSEDRAEVQRFAVALYRDWIYHGSHANALRARRRDETLEQRRDLNDLHARVLRHYSELAGHDLACWCPLGTPCHADVLLELANKEVTV